MTDPWEDEGFGGEDDWEGMEGVESGLADEEEDDDLDLSLELEDDGYAGDDELDDSL
jgi:hypothetical protein